MNAYQEKKKKFRHWHLLTPLHFDEESEEIKCMACERLIIAIEPSHGCLSCKYFLHDQCLNLTRWRHHPSHNSHPLTLLPTPTYSYGSYSYDACGVPRSSFSFSCAQCEFDLHTHCANLPRTVIIDAHPHELKLTFDIPYGGNGNTSIVCDECGGVDKSFWTYKCVDCAFDWHLNCVKTDQGTGLNQNQLETQDMVGGQPKRANDALDPIRQAANQMMEDQLEMMRLQNQLNGTRLMASANLMTWAWR
ncbi:protein VACUOLELESS GAMETOPHYTES-like [Hevea brasiliensis]|uniref:protein VACUOLELESS GAMETOPHYTES-like n=1 Tax=Hevea brasiliensis TaxID=3981 RepID=UPI0025E6FB0F|nr:protein VACUOLELESS GAMETOPHYTES-like [Hevea brasiliensis]